MFFSIKRLVAQKQQLENKIQNEYKNLDAVYLDLKKAFHELYQGFECVDMFDITTADFWFGDVACSYNGQNYDLSNALFRMNKQLSDVEAEAINNRQLTGIYNIIAILINDLYVYEEPIIIQTDISKKEVLDKLKFLVQKLVISIKNDKSETSERLCSAVQKLYTLLDSSLYNSPKHQHLRQLKKQYLQIQATGYDNIDNYRKEIEEIRKRLEKYNYSEDGKKISRKEIAPFPSLKAYNNAAKLLGCCMSAVEKYENESDMIAPSCSNDVGELLFDSFVRFKDEFNEWDDSIDFDRVAHTMLANATFDMLASGRYHLYAGILNPLNCSANLMIVYDKSMEYGVRNGMITAAEKEEQRNYLLECISEVG